ncbi:MAG TPA: aminotransferase class V-fold PLP-dependent enzyme [Pirellulales bacterium]|nr:aminotransferase class V-fold PLP-dependent enzyme [Pirellulales bacterium]
MGVYEELGLMPIINASGTVTRLGGAPMSPAVLKGFCEAAGQCIPIEHLQAAASRIISGETGTEAAIVTAGAAAALTLGSAAILTGGDLARMERLPVIDGFPHEFVVAREHRNSYDHAVRASGARLVEIGFNELPTGAGVRRVETWEYEAAFGPRTAGVFYVFSPGCEPPLSEVVRCAHAHHLPVLVDAAGELPPRGNLKSIAAMGADLVAYSGGKAIRGPQATGILCGRRDLISAAALQMLDMDDYLELWQPPSELFDLAKLHGMPRHGIGRGLKVSKEQIVALLTALAMFVRGDYDRELEDHRRRLEMIVEQLGGSSASCHIHVSHAECLPLLEIVVDHRGLGRSALEVCRRLRAGSPPCYVGHAGLREGKLIINPLHLDDVRAAELARRLKEELCG